MSVAWIGAGIAAIGVVSSIDSANSAQDQNQQAIDAQSGSAEAQQKLAQEQWDFQKNTFLPKAMQQADAQLALSNKIADQQIKDSDYYKGIAGENFDQAKKSWKYQDQMMATADDYSSGKMGDAEAGRANADVEQAYGSGLQTMQRSAGRMGINAGSGAFASGMQDMALQHAADSAGAQTNARLNARNKAENMVALAAGAGQAGFGTGLGAAGLANNATAGAGQTNNTSGNGLNAVNNSYTQGMNGVNTGLNGSVGSWNSVARNAGNNYNADLWGGLATTATKLYGSMPKSGAPASFGSNLDSFFSGIGGSGD